MTDDFPPNYTPRRLAKHLRESRRSAGVSQIEMAEQMGRTQSWVSLIERGQISLTEEVLDKWCDALGIADDEREILANDFSRENDTYITWRQVWADGADKFQQERGAIEGEARHLRLFQLTLIHSLLQTPQYIEAVYYAMRFFPDDSQLTRYAQARLARQAILHAPHKRIDSLIAETALRSMIAMPDVMATQIEHLAKLSERGLINIGIVPLNAPITVLPRCNWDIFDESIVFVELVSGQVTFTESSELAQYVDVFELLWEDSLKGEEALEFLWSLASEFRDLPLD